MIRSGMRWLASMTLAGVCAVAGTALAETLPGADFAAGWGPDIGTPLPLLEADDHTGAARSFESLKGANGLLLVFSRSVDW